MSRVTFLKALLVSFALSIILVWVSHTVTFNHLAESIQNQYATIRGLPFVFDGEPQVYSSILQPHPFPGCLCVCNEQSEWLDRRSGVSSFAVPEFCNLRPRDLYRNDYQVRCNSECECLLRSRVEHDPYVRSRMGSSRATSSISRCAFSCSYL